MPGKAPRLLLAISVLTCLAGCRGLVTFDKKSVGSSSETSLGSLGGGDECSMVGSPPQVDPEWSGVVPRNFGPSGSSQVRFTLPDPEHGKKGWILFGNGAAEPPPTDADACFPACDFQLGAQRVTVNRLQDWHEGYLYPIEDVHKSERKIWFEVNANSPFDAWCRLQTPVRNGEGYACLGEGEVTIRAEGCKLYSPSGDPEDINCCRAVLCDRAAVCDCDKRGCRASQELRPVQLLQDTDMSYQIVLGDSPVSPSKPLQIPDAAVPDGDGAVHVL